MTVIAQIKGQQQMNQAAPAVDPAQEAEATQAWMAASGNSYEKAEEGYYFRAITDATGAKPIATDRVLVHYTGKLLDGTVFDSSVERGQPIDFSLNGVIAGWTLGLQRMSVGSKYELVIPSDLAYGPQGRPGIPGNATLVFEVELLEILK